MVSIGVFGCGYWGKNLVRNYAELGALRAMCDVDQKKLKKFAVIYPNIKTINPVSQLVNDPTTDAVVIASPAELHYLMAKEALLASKHVFMEKPLALDVEQGKELVDIVTKKGKILMKGHILRYHPVVNKLKELVDKSELGKIQYVYSNQPNIGQVRNEENILWSFVPHDVSVILFLLSEFAESICATGAKCLQLKGRGALLAAVDEVMR